MPGTATRVLEKTLAHLSSTLEQAEQPDIHSSNRAFAHQLDARIKVIGASMLTIAVVSARRLTIVLCLLVLFTSLALLSKISWRRILSAWAGGIFFAAIVAVPAIFTSGWNIALLLITRSEASLTCWLIVVTTTPFNRVLRALRSLRIPVIGIAILSMTFRFIFLLVQTAQDMLLSRRSRIVSRLSGAGKRQLLSSTTGVLLGKTVQMSDDVYQAMISRGFRGEVYLLHDLHIKTADWWALALIAAITLSSIVAGRL